MNRAAVDLDRTFAALADPTRRAILERLAEGPTTLNELARRFPMTLQAVSKHLKVLEHAGLVSRGRVAQARPAHLSPAALHGAADWLARYRRFFEESYERLDELLADGTGGTGGSAAAGAGERGDAAARSTPKTATNPQEGA